MMMCNGKGSVCHEERYIYINPGCGQKFTLKLKTNFKYFSYVWLCLHFTF